MPKIAVVVTARWPALFASVVVRELVDGGRLAIIRIEALSIEVLVGRSPTRGVDGPAWRLVARHAAELQQARCQGGARSPPRRRAGTLGKERSIVAEPRGAAGSLPRRSAQRQLPGVISQPFDRMNHQLEHAAQHRLDDRWEPEPQPGEECDGSRRRPRCEHARRPAFAIPSRRRVPPAVRGRVVCAYGRRRLARRASPENSPRRRARPSGARQIGAHARKRSEDST